MQTTVSINCNYYSITNTYCNLLRRDCSYTFSTIKHHILGFIFNCKLMIHLKYRPTYAHKHIHMYTHNPLSFTVRTCVTTSGDKKLFSTALKMFSEKTYWWNIWTKYSLTHKTGYYFGFLGKFLTSNFHCNYTTPKYLVVLLKSNQYKPLKV